MGSTLSKSSTSIIIQGENKVKNRDTLSELEHAPYLINLRDSDGNTLLHRACKGGNKQLVDKLLSKGAEIDSTNNKGLTPLHLACWEGHEPIATTLLAHSANINARDNNGCTALHFACEGGHTAVAVLLMSAIEPVPIERDALDMGGWTALHEACRRGHYELARTLIVLGVNISLKNHDGNAALEYVTDDHAREILTNAAEYIKLSTALSQHPGMLPITMKNSAMTAFPERSISWESMNNHQTLQMASMV